MKLIKLNTKQIALMSVFATLQVIMGRLPGIPLIGVSGRIEPTVLLLPVIGIILGPWIGGLSVFLGDFITWIIPSVTFFGLLMLPAGLIGAMVTGALSGKMRSGWKVSAIILGALILLYYVSPVGVAVPYYPLLHLAALALILLFRGRVFEFLRSEDRRKITWGTIVSSFGGVMANHMTGTIIFIYSTGFFIELKGIKDALKALGFTWLKSGLPNPENIGPLGTLLAIIFPISIVERIAMTAIAVIVGAGVLYALKKSGVISFI